MKSFIKGFKFIFSDSVFLEAIGSITAILLILGTISLAIYFLIYNLAIN